MVDVLVYLALGLSLLSLGSLIVLVRYLPVLRRASNAYVESSDVISSMMKELNARASLQDRRLADVQVKLDTLEDRWLRVGWMASQAPVSYSPPITNRTSITREETEGTVLRHSLESAWSAVGSKEESQSFNQGDLSVLSKVEILVLRNLAGRRMTAPDVKGVLGSSREHAARIMKSLTDKGFVVRDASKKPYSYELSDAGRDAITGNPLRGL
jgi:hypothetical protein